MLPAVGQGDDSDGVPSLVDVRRGVPPVAERSEVGHAALAREEGAAPGAAARSAAAIADTAVVIRPRVPLIISGPPFRGEKSRRRPGTERGVRSMAVLRSAAR